MEKTNQANNALLIYAKNIPPMGMNLYYVSSKKTEILENKKSKEPQDLKFGTEVSKSIFLLEYNQCIFMNIFYCTGATNLPVYFYTTVFSGNTTLFGSCKLSALSVSCKINC